jgi:triacylglycerol lipase
MKAKRFDPKTTEFSKDNLAYLAHFANIVYKNKDEVRTELTGIGFTAIDDDFFIEDEITHTQCIVVADKEKIILAFRGTEGKLEDLITDFKAWKHDLESFGSIHRGFYDAFYSIWPKAKEKILKLRTNNQSIWVTGHSLGGALASIAAGAIYLQKELAGGLLGVYTFGQPRVGDFDFAEKYDSGLKNNTYRIVHNNDVVTRVPPQNMGYSHTGSLKYFDADGMLHSDDQLSWWATFWDRLRSRLKNFLKLRLDGIKDHKMNKYQELSEKAAGWLKKD